MGGWGGAINASFALDSVVHNTAWIQGHFHLTVGTAVALPFMGTAYWLVPRLTGNDLELSLLAKVQPYLWFLGMLLFSFANHITRLMGMPRRVWTYSEGLGWSGYNLISTLGAWGFGAAVLLFVGNAAWSVWRGPAAGAGRFRFCRSVLCPLGAGGVRRVRSAPFIANTARTLPTRSITTKPDGWPWACASATPWAMMRWISETVRPTTAGVWKTEADPTGGVGAGCSGGDVSVLQNSLGLETIAFGLELRMQPVHAVADDQVAPLPARELRQPQARDEPAVGEGSKGRDAQIDPHGSAARARRCLRDLDVEPHLPALQVAPKDAGANRSAFRQPPVRSKARQPAQRIPSGVRRRRIGSRWPQGQRGVLPS